MILNLDLQAGPGWRSRSTRRVYSILTSALLAIGVLTAVRFLAGPYCFVVRINSPLNLESFFAVLCTALLVIRSRRKQCTSPGSNISRPGVWALGLVFIVFAVWWRTLFFPFTSDDYVLLELSKVFRMAPELLFRAGGDGYYRPVGYVAIGLNGVFGPAPVLWHLPGLLLHVSNTLLVFLLAARVGMALKPAFVTAAIFGIHGTRPEAVAWVAGRFDVLSAFWLLGGLVLFTTYLERRRPYVLAAAVACETIAILSKESAYAFLLFVVLLIWLQPRPVRRFRDAIPFVAVALLLLGYRLILFHGIGGYLNPRTGAPEAYSIGAAAAAKALLLRLWALLYFPVNWSRQPGVLLASAACAYIVALAALAFANPNRKRLAFALGFVLAAALPALSQLLIGADLEKSRLLYLPAAGFALLLGTALEAVAIPRARAVAAGAILVFQFAALTHNLRIWEDVVSLGSRTCIDARSRAGLSRPVIAEGLPASIDGVYFFRNGFPECVRMDAAGARSEGAPMVLRWNQTARKLEPAN